MCSVSSNSRLRHGAGHDAGARVDVGLTVLQHRTPDGDRGVEVAVVAEVAHRTTVQPAPLPFRGGDELHGPDLGRTAEGPRREDRPQRIERVEVGLQAAFDVRHEVEYVAVALDLHVLADRHGPGAGDSTEVVPAQVDEHHVLSTLLGVLLELLGEELVLTGVCPAWPRSGDRVGRELVALGLEQQLRRGADHLELGRPDEEQVRARVHPPQRSIEPDAVERPTGRRIERQAERLASGEDDLDRLAGRDRVLGDLDGPDVLLATEARVDRPGQRRLAVRAGRRSGKFRGTRSCRPLQSLEDGRLGDAIAALEVRCVGVERRDRRKGVGQVVEDEDQVGLDERSGRDADRVALREPDRGLECGHGVVRDSADGAAGESGHPVGGLDAAGADEIADGVERISRFGRLDREVGRVGRDGDRSRLDPGTAVADLEKAARADPEERVAAETLPAFDRLEEIGRVAVVEAEECADRGLEVGRTRGAQADRVRAAGEPFGLAQADGVGCGHRLRPRESDTTDRPWDERSCLPRCHPHSAMPHSRDRRMGFPTDRRCPVSLALCAGAYLGLIPVGTFPFGPEAPGSIHRLRRPGFHQPPGLSADARRVLVPFIARSS